MSAVVKVHTMLAQSPAAISSNVRSSIVAVIVGGSISVDIVLCVATEKVAGIAAYTSTIPDIAAGMAGSETTYWPGFAVVWP